MHLEDDERWPPPAFQTSYLHHSAYPKNLLHRTIHTHSAGLQHYRDQLESAEDYLVDDEGGIIDVSFRDLGLESGDELGKHNIRNLEKLEEWLGVTTHNVCELQSEMVRSEKRDPKSRFIYIYGEHSRARLNITMEMLLRILTFHQVMPAYLDFMSVFGERIEQPDERFSAFKIQRHLKESSVTARLAVPSLGRSGRNYQLCYNLKCVAFKGSRRGLLDDDPASEEWSIRQAAFHHQFDVVEGSALWIVTKGGEDLRQRYKALTGDDGRPEDRCFDTPAEGFQSSLVVHLMFCYWALEDWTGHVRWLERAVEAESLLAVIGPRGRAHGHKLYESADVQRLQQWEEKAQLAIVVLQGNVDVMRPLSLFYEGLGSNKDFPLRHECAEFIDEFVAEVKDMMGTLQMHVSRVQALVRVIRDRRELVAQHLHSQATERMEALTTNMEREAIVVRIITIVTLVYLPATFVSTFFSTDVIKYQNQDGGTDGEGSYSKTAMARWLQVALPLTFITLLFAWCAKNWAETQNSRRRHLASKPLPGINRPTAVMKSEFQLEVTPQHFHQQVNPTMPMPRVASTESTISTTASRWPKLLSRSRGSCPSDLPLHGV